MQVRLAESIREKVRQGFDELNRGDFEEFDESGNTKFFAELMAGIEDCPISVKDNNQTGFAGHE